jgi:hypothetical protein
VSCREMFLIMLKKVKEKDKKELSVPFVTVSQSSLLLELNLFITFSKSLLAVPHISIFRVNQTHYWNCGKILLRNRMVPLVSI